MSTAPNLPRVPSVRLDAEGAAALDRLVQRWRHTPSEVVRRLLAAADDAEALRSVEQATPPRELVRTQRYKALYDATVSIDMGPGFEPRTTDQAFRAGQIIDRVTCRAGLPEQLHAARAQLWRCFEALRRGSATASARY